jgi:hypothetical protein
MSGPEGVAATTPNRGRLVEFEVSGKPFAFRRPSRADESAANNLLALKLVGFTGMEDERRAREDVDFNGKWWEARLEVGLTPREGKSLGEAAPPEWCVAGKIDWDAVDPDEFKMVCARLDEIVYQKKTTTPTASSTSTAPAPASA